MPETLQDYTWGVNLESLESIQGSPVQSDAESEPI